jgi:hypothetical protein
MDQLRYQLTLLLSLALAACGGDGRAAGRDPAHVDSSVPRAVEIARFREGLIEPTELAGGAASRDALVRSYVRALARADTAELAALAITRAEFAYLYYPTNPEAHPPYDLAPGLMWFMLEQNSRKGLLHALADRGGRSLGYAGYRCDATPSRQGANTVWGSCVVRHRQSGGVIEERLFAQIVARNGRFKFVSLANKL